MRPSEIHITVTYGMRGYYPVMVGIYDVFFEAIIVGPISYSSYEKAKEDGIEWAKAERIPFKD